MNKLHYLWILVILIPFVAGQEILTYTQDAAIDIKETCHNNGTLCSNSALCNITVINPSGDNLVDNLAMTQDTSLAFFNFTLTSSQTSEVGFYRYDIVCSDGGNANFGSFNLQVTAGGTDPSLPQVVTNGLLLAILFFTFIFNMWGVMHLSWNNKTDGEIITINYMKHVKTILIFTAYLQLIFITWVGWMMSESAIYLDFASSILRVVFWGLLGFLFPIFAGLWVFTVIFLLNDKKMHKAIVRGIPVR